MNECLDHSLSFQSLVRFRGALCPLPQLTVSCFLVEFMYPFRAGTSSARSAQLCWRQHQGWGAAQGPSELATVSFWSLETPERLVPGGALGAGGVSGVSQVLGSKRPAVMCRTPPRRHRHLPEPGSPGSNTAGLRMLAVGPQRAQS